METFKVVCKAERSCWGVIPCPTKIVYEKKLFGLIKKPIVVANPQMVCGPGREEICVVYKTYQRQGLSFYILAGYGEDGYCTKHFIRLDELTETQKEIEEKSQSVLN